jgi:hypothetical protein
MSPAEVRIVAIIAAAVTALTLSLETASGGHRTTPGEGGTFRLAISTGIFQSIDPALYGLESRILRPACAALMNYSGGAEVATALSE